jgi:uncharacterized membrane protein YeaQ/YmgE (transglycosylase-associated protein family)
MKTVTYAINCRTPVLGISAGGLIGSIITAVAGAAALLFVVGLIKRQPG